MSEQERPVADGARGDATATRAIVSAAVAWVGRIVDHPNEWADEYDRALIDATTAYMTTPAWWSRVMEHNARGKAEMDATASGDVAYETYAEVRDAADAAEAEIERLRAERRISEDDLRAAIAAHPYFGRWDEWAPLAYDRIPVVPRMAMSHLYGRHDDTDRPYAHCVLCAVFRPLSVADGAQGDATAISGGFEQRRVDNDGDATPDAVVNTSGYERDEQMLDGWKRTDAPGSFVKSGSAGAWVLRSASDITIELRDANGEFLAGRVLTVTPAADGGETVERRCARCGHVWWVHVDIDDDNGRSAAPCTIDGCDCDDDTLVEEQTLNVNAQDAHIDGSGGQPMSAPNAESTLYTANDIIDALQALGWVDFDVALLVGMLEELREQARIDGSGGDQ